MLLLWLLRAACVGLIEALAAQAGVPRECTCRHQAIAEERAMPAPAKGKTSYLDSELFSLAEELIEKLCVHEM
jgi:hypothetical protein